METDILNKIYNIAIDETFSERDALITIMAIVEDRLAQFGMFPEGYDPNDNGKAL